MGAEMLPFSGAFSLCPLRGFCVLCVPLFCSGFRTLPHGYGASGGAGVGGGPGDLGPEGLGGGEGPAGIPQQFAAQQHEIAGTLREDVLGLLGIGDEAHGTRGKASFGAEARFLSSKYGSASKDFTASTIQLGVTLRF